MANNTLQYKDYLATVHYSDADQLFYGTLLGINDLIIFEGNSVSALKKEFKNAVDDYLETCKELGKEPQKMYKGSFNIRIPSELHREAALLASQNGVSLNDFVRASLEYYVNSGAAGSAIVMNNVSFVPQSSGEKK